MTTPGESAKLLEAHVRERLVGDGWVGRADPYHESALDKNFRVHVFLNMATRSGFPISLTPSIVLIYAPANAYLRKLYGIPGWRWAWFMGHTFGQLEKLLPGDSGHPYSVSNYQGREQEAADGLAAFADHVGRPWLEQYASVDAAVAQIFSGPPRVTRPQVSAILLLLNGKIEEANTFLAGLVERDPEGMHTKELLRLLRERADDFPGLKVAL